MTIRALVYDAYGTIFDVSSVIGRCETHFPGKGAQISDLWRTKQLEYTWLLSLMGRYKDFWHLTEAGLRFSCRALSLELTDDIRHDLMDNYLSLTPYTEVAATLESLSQKIPQAILSNGSKKMLNTVVENAGLNKFLGNVLSVDDVGIFKPAPKVYQLATDRLGIPTEEIGFVSSNSWDAAGAKAFGFQVFWINRFQRPVEELELDPDFVIDTLDKILPMIG